MPPVLRSWLESRSVESPARPLTDASLIEALGGMPTASGVTVNEKNAVKIGAVFRAVSLISGSVAGLPLHVHRYGSFEKIDNTLLTEPSPSYTDFEFWELVTLYLLLWGNSYSEKIYTPLGRLAALEPIAPWRVKVERTDRTEANPQGRLFWIDGDKKRTPNEIFHIPGMGYDGLVGLSVVQCAKQSLGVAMAAETSAAKLYANGSMMSGILTTDANLDEPTAERLKQRWQKKVGGAGNAHEIAVLSNGAKFQPVSMNPDDAQFLESREFQVTDIARWFGLPPWMLADVAKSTSWGTGIEQQGIAYVVYTLRSWLKRIEKRVSKELLPRGQYSKFVVEGLLRGDTKSRYEAYAIGKQWGWLSTNKILEKEDEEPVEGGDVYLQPLNMVPMGTEPEEAPEEEVEQ